MNRLAKGFDAYGDADDTIQEKLRSYWLHIGVTEAELPSNQDVRLQP